MNEIIDETLVLGWIKLYRKSIDSVVFTNANLWQVWCYCLLRARHKSATIFFNNEEVKLKVGAFITGRFAGATACNMKPPTYWYCIKKLQRIGCISIKSDSKKSIITILNWALYQATSSSMTPSLSSTEQQSHTNKNGRKTESQFISPQKIMQSLPHSKFTETQKLMAEKELKNNV